MLFSLAVLPAVALLIYVYKMDKKEKEPTKFLWRLFRWGVFIIIPTYLIESILDFFVEAITIVGSIPYAILDAFIVAACTEELLKYYFLKSKTWKSPNFDCMFDGIVYSVFVSLGFAAIENIAYVMDEGLFTALMRMFTSVPGHACFAIYMGFYYSKAKLAFKQGDGELYKLYKRKAVVIPIILHGIYDCLIMVDEAVVGEDVANFAFIIWMIFIVVFYKRAFKLVGTASRDDEFI